MFKQKCVYNKQNWRNMKNIYNDHIRQIVNYIYLKLFGGTMCIVKIFMINSSNQWCQYFIFTVILNIHIWYRHPGVWYLQVTREEKVSGGPGSSFDPPAHGPSHIMSGKSQKSSQSTLPPRKDIVKAVLHINFFGVFQAINTSSTNKCKSYRTKRQIIPIPNLHLCSSSQKVTVTSCKGMTWYVKIVYKCI
jgi:hypothetical protein